MNRIEFMNRLEQLLENLPEDEKNEALRYYNDYFDDAGADREYEVIQELVSPEHVAQTVYDSAGYQFSDREAYANDVSDQNSYQYKTANDSAWQGDGGFDSGSTQATPNQTGYRYDGNQEDSQKKSNTGMIIAIVVLILTAPVTIPVVCSVISVIVSIILGIFGCIIGFFVGGIAVLIAAVVLFTMGEGIIGLLCLGIGFFLLCLEMLLWPFVIWFCRTAVPACFRLVKKGWQKLFQKGGNVQ